MGECMRIISGEARGRKLFAPPGVETRPTSDKIRGSVFNILGGSVRGAKVLDLFGGTGALALEAISRGADSAIIVDASRAAIQAIERNAENVAKADFGTRVRVLRSDYRSAIGLLPDGDFDLVFLDPPYRMVEAYADALLRLEGAGLLATECTIVLERLKAVPVSVPEVFESHDVRFYGETAVEFLRRRNFQLN